MNKSKATEKKRTGILTSASELVEMLGLVTVAVMLLFAFVVRLNIVVGESMEQTLSEGEYLVVSDLFYEPKAGDIVIVHDIEADPYDDPIVKRVIATEGQTVDIVFGNEDVWTLYVDGKEVEESYRYIVPNKITHGTITAEYSLPITVGEGQVFVMGDNRNNSADSRSQAIGLVDERCIVGKAIVRLLPFDRFTVFKNPFGN
ncbi:MAG: signal peptidase I [Ruminococcaceae bacterium]|nr:signal peptidase I [Oscillospiraceae bacterium]